MGKRTAHYIGGYLVLITIACSVIAIEGLVARKPDTTFTSHLARRLPVLFLVTISIVAVGGYGWLRYRSKDK